MALGLGAEALAVLDMSEAAGLPGTTEASTARALRAAADLLLGRAAEAGRLLASLAHIEDPELSLWRALAAAGGGNSDRAWSELRRSGTILDRYPPRLRRRIGPMAVRIALTAEALDAASALIANLRNLDLAPSETAELDLLEADLLTGRTPSIVPEQLLRRAIATGGWSIATEAAFALTAARERAGAITAEAARQELTDQRLLWRGHPDEIAMLEHLAGLELRTGEPTEAAEILSTILERGISPQADTPASAAPPAQLFLAVAEAARTRPAVAITALAIYRRHPTLLAEGDRRQVLQDLGLGLQAAGLDDSARSLTMESPHAAVASQ